MRWGWPGTCPFPQTSICGCGLWAHGREVTPAPTQPPPPALQRSRRGPGRGAQRLPNCKQGLGRRGAAESNSGDESVSAQTSPRPHTPGKRAPVLEPQMEEKPEAPLASPQLARGNYPGTGTKTPLLRRSGLHAPHAASAPLPPVPQRWQNSHLSSFPGPRGSQTRAP